MSYKTMDLSSPYEQILCVKNISICIFSLSRKMKLFNYKNQAGPCRGDAICHSLTEPAVTGVTQAHEGVNV